MKMRLFSILTLLGSASAVVFEAENAVLTGDLNVATAVPGFSGTGYVANFQTSNDTILFNVTGLSAGSYDIAVIFSAQYGNKYTSVSVNGAASEVAINNVTTSDWATSPVGSFALTSGSNTVLISNDWGWYFIDAITVVPTPAAPIIVTDVSSGAIVEAETGIMNGVTVGTGTAGFSGTGFIQGYDTSTDSVTLTVYSDKQALYDLVVRYAAIYGGKQTTMSLNGQGGAEVVLADTTTAASPWANATAGQVLLNAGNNTISFVDDWGWYFIDCIYVTPSPPPAPHKVSNMLVAPSPLPVTQALFDKLLSKYGSGEIFSGQADPSGVTWLEQNIGKTPAIIGLDMIDYSPTRVEFQGNVSHAVEDAIAFDARGGIVAFQWHWNAPADLVNNATVLWWQGIYTYGTTFNLTAALANPNGTDYALLISDMDAIAIQLLRLQAANIPILFRPLHEAEGGWFWWGAWGPESAKTLYRIMFDRYTNHHQLHNLIWVWNSVSPSWYPGADVVDILGYDSYPAIGDHGPVSTQYQELLALGNDEKMVTLPEVGNIPDPSLLKAYHADWSYFVTWNQDYILTDTYNSLAFKEMVYNDSTVLKLSDLGNWKGTATALPTTSTMSSSISTSTSTSWALPSTTSSIIWPTLKTTKTVQSSSPLPFTTSTSASKSSTSSHTTSKSKSSTSTSTKSTKSRTLTTSTTTPAPSATVATAAHWAQCGGTGWTGATVCAAGTTCTAVADPWYWQCL